MIIVVFIFSLLTIITIFSLSNYIFAQGYIGGAETDAYSIEEQLKLAQEKTSNGLQTVEYNETVTYNWKTCSEPKLGVSIEYPSHWLNTLEYNELDTEVEKEYYAKHPDRKYSTQINSNATQESSSCLKFYNFPMKYGNSTVAIKEKLMGEMEDKYYYFYLDLPYQISFSLHPDKFKEAIKYIEDNYDLPFDLADYNSIKVLTRIFALERSGYALSEKPTFDKYNIDGMKIGSFSYSTQYENYEYILTIHDDILYTFVFESKENLDIPEEEYSTIKKYIINSIKWLN